MIFFHGATHILSYSEGLTPGYIYSREDNPRIHAGVLFATRPPLGILKHGLPTELEVEIRTEEGLYSAVISVVGMAREAVLER